MEEGDLIEGAEEWLGVARKSREEGWNHAAFESARKAAELAAKALLGRKTGGYPKDHDVSGILYRERLIPADVAARELSRLLAAVSVGTYAFDQAVHRKDVAWALRIAERMVKACRG